MKKIQLIWLSLFLIFSSGCITKYKITICASVPDKGGFNCSKGGDKPYFLDYKDSHDYLAIPQDDVKVLLDKCEAWKDE